jgi:hypothetical protein
MPPERCTILSVVGLNVAGFSGGLGSVGFSQSVRPNPRRDADHLLRLGTHTEPLSPAAANRGVLPISIVEEGIELGRRADLIGGGLIRSSGGWRAIKSMRPHRIHARGDERILEGKRFRAVGFKLTQRADGKAHPDSVAWRWSREGCGTD